MLRRADGSGIDDAERIAEITVRISEYAQHGHVDAHDSDPTALPRRQRSGGTAFVGAEGLQYRDAGVVGPGNALCASAGAEQFAKRGLVVVRRRGSADEALDNLDEPVGVVVEREMPGTLEDLELRTRHRGVGHVSVADG